MNDLVSRIFAAQVELSLFFGVLAGLIVALGKRSLSSVFEAASVGMLVPTAILLVATPFLRPELPGKD